MLFHFVCISLVAESSVACVFTSESLGTGRRPLPSLQIGLRLGLRLVNLSLTRVPMHTLLSERRHMQGRCLGHENRVNPMQGQALLGLGFAAHTWPGRATQPRVDALPSCLVPRMGLPPGVFALEARGSA